MPTFLAELAGVRYDIETLIAEGPLVAAAYRLSATSREHPIDLRGVMMVEVRDGLIARRIDYWDSLTFLRQVGDAPE